MVTPLKHSLESFPTVWRASRYLGLEFDNTQMKELGTMVRKAYPGHPPKANQMEGEFYMRVFRYPREFLPEMLEIITQYHKKINKPKRKRITKEPSG